MKVFLNTNEEGYNIHKIYQPLEKVMINVKSVIPSNKKDNPYYILGTYLNESDYKSLLEFSQFDFTTDFYNHLLKEKIKLNPEFINSHKGFRKGRDYIKKHFMSIFFGFNDEIREKILWVNC